MSSTSVSPLPAVQHRNRITWASQGQILFAHYTNQMEAVETAAASAAPAAVLLQEAKSAGSLARQALAPVFAAGELNYVGWDVPLCRLTQ